MHQLEMQKEHVRSNETTAVPVHMESRSQQLFGMSRAPLEGALRDIVTFRLRSRIAHMKLLGYPLWQGAGLWQTPFSLFSSGDKLRCQLKILK